MNKVAIVYPQKLPQNRKTLVPFYDAFINLLISSNAIQEITIIHRKGLKEQLQSKFPSNKVILQEFNTVQDIWIRDFAPFYMHDSVAYKAIYNPCYYTEYDKPTRFKQGTNNIYYYAHFDDKVGSAIPINLNIKTTKIDLVLDGGNFIHNGNGIAITTNRIITENESLSIDSLKNLFKTHLGINKLIILPVEPGDETGHIDGMVRFVNQNTVIVGAYDENYPVEKKFMDKIAEDLKSEFTVIRIFNDLENGNQKTNTNSIASANGNYINYLQVGNTIFLPQYGNQKDIDAKVLLEKYFTVVLVTKDIDKLANEGGVLNCITWNY